MNSFHHIVIELVRLVDLSTKCVVARQFKALIKWLFLFVALPED